LLDLRKISFGGPAALVTSMGLIVGLRAAGASQGALVGSLLIVAMADNLTDALGIHIYQEAEQLPQKEALRTTAANFVVRFVTALTFVVIVLLAPALSVPMSVAWGALLLAGLSYLIGRMRGVNPASEILKHLGAATLVIITSRLIGAWLMGLSVSAAAR
jgi:VIT1/CCC1 family predicted Fe2+/Mn2+ transporter